MKETTKKYLESESKLNEQEFRIRNFGFKLCILLTFLGLGLIAFAMYKALA